MRFLAASLLLLSVSAMACPDLSGSYPVCRSTTGDSSGSKDMIITQKADRGITTYTMSFVDEETQEAETETLIADGKTRSETAETEMGTLTATVNVVCSGDALISKMAISIAGEELAAINNTMTKSGKTLVQDITGHLFNEQMKEYLICE